MSLTFTLTGNSSVLSSDFNPPIDLDPNSDYALALIGFHTYNSIPNIEEGVNNKFYFSYKHNRGEIFIPTGSYEIDDLETYLQNQLQLKGYIPSSSSHLKGSYLSIKANNNTLKCEIKGKFLIDFTKSDSIGNILGFSKRLLHPDITYESDIPVNIVQILTIRVECNIVFGSFYNSERSHTLYEFSPNVDPGYSINIEPRNLVYLPVHNNRSINNITIRLNDKYGKLVNFRGEDIVVRLELKKIK